MSLSRYWADVAINTPVLWSRISVSQHDGLEKARRKLTRSKSCPLDVTINFGARMEYSGRVTEQVIHAMDLIRPALWRTKSFSLSVPNRPQAHAALLRCQEDAPMLETLSIRIYHAMQEDVPAYSNPPLPLFNGRTPRLRSCSLTSFNFGWDTRLVTRLRVLKLGGYFNSFSPSPSTLLTILHQCPELEELALRNLYIDSDSCGHSDDIVPAPTTKPVQLPRLTKLSFYYAGIALARQILSQITFPNLESLEMCYLENVTPVIQLLYEQALTRLPLRNLRIESSLFNDLKFMNLLRRLPSLTTLELVDVEDASSNLLKVRNTCFHFQIRPKHCSRAFLLLSPMFAPNSNPSPLTGVPPSTGTPFAPLLSLGLLLARARILDTKMPPPSGLPGYRRPQLQLSLRAVVYLHDHNFTPFIALFWLST